MSKGIYDILGKLASVTPKEEPKQETSKPIYESVEAKGSVLAGVDKVESRLQKQFNESSVSQAQAHMMAGAAHDPAFAKKVGVKQSVAKEFNRADTGKKISKLPKHVEEGSAHGYNVVKWYDKWGDQIKLIKWLKKECGLGKNIDVYFDDADLVLDDKTILDNALANPKFKLVDLVNALARATGKPEFELRQGSYYNYPAPKQPVEEDEAFISDDVWRAAKRLAHLNGTDVQNFGEQEVNQIADQFGIPASDVAEILELTSNGAVCGECGMNEGTCEHTQIAESGSASAVIAQLEKADSAQQAGKIDAAIKFLDQADVIQQKINCGDTYEIHNTIQNLIDEMQSGEYDTYEAHNAIENIIDGLSEISENYVHKGTYGTSYDAGDDEDDEPKAKKGKGRPKKADNEKSSASLPWGGTLSGKKSKPAKGSWGMKDGEKYGKVNESVNFKKLLDDTHMSVDEMIASIQNDIRDFKSTGKMSDALRDFVDLHRHSRKQADEALIPSPTDIKFATPAVTRKAAAPAGDNSWMINQADFDQKDLESPTTHAGLAQRKRDLGIDATHELNELAKLAGLEVKEATAESAGANAYEVSVDLYDRDEPVTVTVHTDADLTNCDEDMFRSEIEDCLREQGIDVDEDVAQWDLLNPPEGWSGLSLDEADAPVANPKTAPVNAPEPKYGTVKQITTQGDDLNRQKKQFASKPFRGDNPMSAELEGKLAEMYNSIKIKK